MIFSNSGFIYSKTQSILLNPSFPPSFSRQTCLCFLPCACALFWNMLLSPQRATGSNSALQFLHFFSSRISLPSHLEMKANDFIMAQEEQSSGKQHLSTGLVKWSLSARVKIGAPGVPSTCSGNPEQTHPVGQCYGRVYRCHLQGESPKNGSPELIPKFVDFPRWRPSGFCTNVYL